MRKYMRKEECAILVKQCKQKEKSISSFQKAHRPDISSKTQWYVSTKQIIALRINKNMLFIMYPALKNAAVGLSNDHNQKIVVMCLQF